MLSEPMGLNTLGKFSDFRCSKPLKDADVYTLALTAWLAIADYRSVDDGYERLLRAQRIAQHFKFVAMEQVNAYHLKDWVSPPPVVARTTWLQNPVVEQLAIDPKKYLSLPESEVNEETFTPIQHEIFRWMVDKMMPEFRKHPTCATYESWKAQGKNRVHPGDFDMGAILGQSSFGVIGSAIKKSTGTLYALKIESKTTLLKARQANEIQTERRIIETLHSPFVASMKYAFSNGSMIFTAMDIVQGPNLEQALRKAGGRFTEERTFFPSLPS
jgi:hypothetical protein